MIYKIYILYNDKVMKALETGFLNSVSMKLVKKLTIYKLEKKWGSYKLYI